MSLDREQHDINLAEHAKALRDNPFFQRMMLEMKAGYVDKLTKIKKGPWYERKLKDVHDSLQNLAMIEGLMLKAINDGKIAEGKRKQRNS